MWQPSGSTPKWRDNAMAFILMFSPMACDVSTAMNPHSNKVDLQHLWYCQQLSYLSATISYYHVYACNCTLSYAPICGHISINGPTLTNTTDWKQQWYNGSTITEATDSVAIGFLVSLCQGGDAKYINCCISKEYLKLLWRDIMKRIRIG